MDEGEFEEDMKIIENIISNEYNIKKFMKNPNYFNIGENVDSDSDHYSLYESNTEYISDYSSYQDSSISSSSSDESEDDY